MINAQFARLASAVLRGLSDRSLPCGTADHALNAMAKAEIEFEVEKTRNRLQCDAHRVLGYVRDGISAQPSPKRGPLRSAVPITTPDDWGHENGR